MKLRLAIVLLIAVAASLASAQTENKPEKAKGDGKVSIDQEFKKIENTWAEADKNKDPVALGRLLADIFKVRVGKPVAVVALLFDGQKRHLRWVVDGEGAEEHPIDHAEERGVGADAESEREHGHSGESGLLAQHPQGKTQFLHHLLHHCVHGSPLRVIRASVRIRSLPVASPLERATGTRPAHALPGVLPGC